MWWYATRAAGLMTWLTATAAVVVGLALSLKFVRSRTGPWLLDLHRFLGGISAVFLIAHVGTLFADSYVDLEPRDLFIPGESAWETEAMAWGIVAAYVLIAVEVTSLLRSQLRRRIWWFIHGLSFVTVGAGGYHAWIVGSDVHNPIAWTIAGTGSLMVLGLVSLRMQRGQQEEDPTGMHLGDRESILLEMRQRLEDLPVPDSIAPPQYEVDPSAVLPRRAAAPDVEQPQPDDLPGHTAEPQPAAVSPFGGPPPTDAPPFGYDPFEAVSSERATTDPEDRLDPAPPDLFGAGPATPPPPPAAPAAGHPDPFAAGPFEQPATEPSPIDWNTGQDPFDPGTLDATTPASPPPPPAAPADPFAPATPEEAEHTVVGNPFNPVDPPPSSINVAVDDPAPAATAAPFPAHAFETTPAYEPVPTPRPEPEPAAAPAEAPAPPPAPGGPPPLPVDAVDPVTGEPDRAAYTEWLKDWLVFAENYGDTAPDDPSRV